MRYVLDTTVLIDHVNGYAPGVAVVARLFAETGDLYSCDVVACEALSKGDIAQRQDMQALLDVLEYVSIGPDDARWAGEQRRRLAGQGRRHPVADALVAAAANGLGATVVTRNAADFTPFGVPVLDYGSSGERA